ncbi:10577_t:CDS:2, partial [Paraglomus brasilianum]
MQSKIDSLRQQISELEAEKVELEPKNAKLLKQVIVMEESTKCEAENEPSPTKDISPLIESHSDGEKGITPNPLPKIEHSNSSTQSESSMEPSLPQDIIDDDSAEILDFVETIHKERINSKIRERNQEKKLQKSHNNLTPLIQSEASTMPTLTSESLDLKI